MPHYSNYGGTRFSAQPADELTGTFNALNETTNFDDRGFSPISGEGVFKPQDIDTKGSVIVGDNHSTPGRGGDSLTGEGRPTKIWTNGGASTFEDRPVGDYDANDAVFGMRESIGANSGPGGSTYMTANIGGTAGPGGTSFMTETFEPAAGMNSFGESLNPVLEVGGTAGPGGSTFMTGQFEMPTDNLGGNSGPGGTSF